MSSSGELPTRWASVELQEVGSVQLGKMLDRKRTQGTPFPYVRNVNVRWGAVDRSDLKVMPFREGEVERFGLRDGDVLVCEGGEPGRAAVWSGGPTDIKYQKAVHRVRLRSAVEPNWLVYHLMHDASRGRLLARPMHEGDGSWPLA